MNGHIRCAHVAHRFASVTALDDLSLEIRPFERVAIIGPSGCGKSTLLRILAGLVRPTSGEVTIDGVDAIGHPGQVAYMPQEDTLLPWRRALPNATLAAELQGSAHDRTQTRARELFSQFGLEGFEGAWPYELSGGMRQRVALLRTVLCERAVLALDEPFAAVDAITRRQLQEWLLGVLGATPVTTVLVTHDIDEALLVADRVAVMSPRPGRIVASFEIPPPRPTSSEEVTDARFATLKRQILRLLAFDGR